MSQFKKKIATYATMLAFLSLSSASIVHAFSPSDVIGKTSNMSIDQNKPTISGTTERYDININDGAGAVGQVDYSKFSVGANQHINFGFSNISQTIINRVLGGQASQILGKITNSCTDGICTSNSQTGKVILINPAGVMFGQGSMVDLNSLTTSTFDFRGAQNLKGMSAAELANYQNGTLNKFSPYAKVDSKTGNTYGDITFDRNYTTAFDKAGLSKDRGAIDIQGATFDHFYNTDIDAANTTKSLNFVADKISYKDSLLRTGDNLSYGGVGSFSNVKMITADGVTFGYLANGYSRNVGEDASSSKIIDNGSNVARSIDINNSKLAANKPAIESGDVYIYNKTKDANSNIKISNSVIKADKLEKFENGDIRIVSSNNVDLDNVRLETANINENTQSKDGGKITVAAGKDLTIKDSLLLSAGQKDRPSTSKAGDILVDAVGNATINDTRIISRGDAVVNDTGKLSMKNTLVRAENNLSKEKHNVEIRGLYSVDMEDSAVSATGNVDISSKGLNSDGKYEVYGDINIKSNLDENGKNKSVIVAGDKLSIQAENTKLDNTSLVYKDLKFYNDGTVGKNNVTVANNTTFTPLDSTGAVPTSKDIVLETNGNLTFDKATVKTTVKGDGYSITLGTDDGTAKGKQFTARSKSVEDAKNITATSTEGDVTVKNSSDINAKNNIKMVSSKGNYTQDSSKLTAGNDVTVTAAKAAKIQKKSTITANNDATVKAANITVSDSTVNAVRNNATLTATGSTSNGNITLTNATVEAANDATVKTAKGTKITVKNSSVIAGSDKTNWDKTKDANDEKGSATIEATAGSVYITDKSKVLSQDENVNIISKNKIVFGNESGVNIDNTVDINAAKNAKIQSTADNIEAEKTTMPTIKYGERLTFNAGKDNIFTSKDSLKSVNVDYVAKGANRIYTTDDAQFVNSSFEAPNNFVESGKDVILNNLTIKKATTDAKDTVTEIFANGNVTTNNVTKEDLKAAGPHTYPQSVSTDRTGTAKTTLDVNKTKLKITTETVKDSKNPDNGSITLDVKNANNEKAGVELVARNVAKLDKDPTGGYHKEGYFKSGTAKWDKKIEAKEGPEVHLNATDNEIAIRTIETDKLTLDAKDVKIADGGKDAVITVKDQGGLNLDPNLDYHTGDGKDPQGFTYEKNYESSDSEVVPGELEFGKWTTWKVIGQKTGEDGKTYRILERTRDGKMTDGSETHIDHKHTVKFDNDGNPSEFTLVYDKKDTTVIPGYTITAEEVRKNPKIVPDGHTPEEFIETKEDPCPDLPVIHQEPSTTDSLITTARLPREQVEISKTSKVADNTVDQTANIMSAAAKVDLSKEADASYSDDDDDAND